MDRSTEFGRWKAQCLSKADLSRKGGVDEDVAEIVQLLNGQEQFFTTSSCSGRIILLEGSINGFEVQKQNCRWLLVTHKPCIKDDVIVALNNANGDAVLKFEPLVLHVQCQQLQDAQILHSVAIDSGFRNSGITVGKRGKTMLAVRSTHGLEVPLSHKGKLMVTEDYIDFLLKIANQKMEENKKRIERETVQIRELLWEQLHFQPNAEKEPLFQCGKEKTANAGGVGCCSQTKSKKEKLSVVSGPVMDLKNKNSFSHTSRKGFLMKRTEHKLPYGMVILTARFYNCLQHALERQTIIKSYPKEKVNEKANGYSHKKKRNREKARDRCITEENDKELENDDSPGLSAAVFPEDD